MTTLIKNFEKDLKNKIEQKQMPNLNQEQSLIKYFKYFDLENTGQCSLREWIKALEKLGVYFNKVSEIQEVFNYYDTNKSGKIDYKNFSKNFSSNAEYKEDTDENNEGFQILNSILSERGGLGLIELYKEFKIFDVNNYKKVGIDDFIKCITNHNIDLSVQQIQSLFNSYEKHNNGQFFYEDLFNDLRCNYWNSEREGLIEKFVTGFLITSVDEMLTCFVGQELESFSSFVENFKFIKNLSSSTYSDSFLNSNDEVKEFLSFFCFGVEENNDVSEFLNNNFKRNTDIRNTISYHKKNKNYNGIKTNSENINNNISASSPELKKFIAKVKNLDRKSFLLMLKQLKSHDNDTKLINKVDFMKVVKDMRLNLTFTDIEELFENFTDRKSRLLHHRNFITAYVLEPLPQILEETINSVFEKLAGLEANISIESLKSKFNRSKDHPYSSIINNVYGEYFDCLELFHSHYLNSKSPFVNRDEFREFYQILYFVSNSDVEFTKECLVADWKSEINNNNNYDNSSNYNNNNVAGKKLSRNYGSTKSIDNRVDKFNTMDITGSKPRGKGQSHMRNKSSIKLGLDDKNDFPTSSFKQNTTANVNVNNFSNTFTRPNIPKQSYNIINGDEYNSNSNNNNRNFNQIANRNNDNTPNNRTPNRLLNKENHKRNSSVSETTNNYKYQKSKKPNLKLDNPEDNNSQSPEEQLISKLRKRNIRGLLHFHKEFLQSNINKITINEFTKILNLQKLNLPKSTITALFRNNSNNNFLNFTSLFGFLKQPLNGNKLNCVEECFAFLDTEETGVIALDDIRLAFTPNTYFGEDLDNVGLEFIDTFELALNIINSQNNNESSLISFQEFANYFEYVAFAIPNEKDFCCGLGEAFGLN